MRPGCGRRHLTPLGAFWTFPNTLLGLGLALLAGALPRWQDGLLVAQSDRGLAHLFLTRRGFGAITFGRVVITTTPPTSHLLLHEGHHARQYEVLGPFFLPVYLALQAGGGYWQNPLEREAAACAAVAEPKPAARSSAEGA